MNAHLHGRRLLIGSVLVVLLAGCASGATPSLAPASRSPSSVVVASSPTATSTALPPVGQRVECPRGSTPDAPGPVDQARPATVETMAFDRGAGVLVALSDAGAGVETWTFDICTNTWTRMHPDREPPGVEWRPLIYDADSGVAILFSSGKVWAYDLRADTWIKKGATPPDATPWAYDPRSGLVVVASYSTGEIWTYDVGSQTWIPVRQAGGPDGTFPYVVYDVSVDRLIGYGTWRFDIRSGTWSRSSAETPVVIAGYGWQAPTLEYDEAAQRTVVFGNAGMALYDASADRWTVLDRGTAPPPDSWPVSMTYDPVNHRLVGCEGSAGVVALDLVTREWTVLLERSGAQSAPDSK